MSFQRRELVAVEVLMRNLLQNKPPHIEEMTRNAVRNGVMFNVSQAVRLISAAGPRDISRNKMMQLLRPNLYFGFGSALSEVVQLICLFHEARTEPACAGIFHFAVNQVQGPECRVVYNRAELNTIFLRILGYRRALAIAIRCVEDLHFDPRDVRRHLKGLSFLEDFDIHAHKSRWNMVEPSPPPPLLPTPSQLSTLTLSQSAAPTDNAQGVVLAQQPMTIETYLAHLREQWAVRQEELLRAEERRKVVNEEATTAPAPLIEKQQEEEEGLSCKVCFGVSEQLIAFIPCGHACCCSVCAGNVCSKTHLCPVCQAPVASSLVVFIV